MGLPKLASVLEHVPPNSELHVQFDELSYIDHACLDLLMNWEKQYEATGGSLIIDWESLTAKFRLPGNHNDKNGHVAASTVSDGYQRVVKPLETTGSQA